MKADEVRVQKSSNGGVGLYVLLRGTHDEIYKGAATAAAKRIASERGWDPEGRGQSGFPSSYGVDTYTRAYHFEQCACHGKYGCKDLTANVVWVPNAFCGTEPNDPTYAGKTL